MWQPLVEQQAATSSSSKSAAPMDEDDALFARVLKVCLLFACWVVRGPPASPIHVLLAAASHNRTLALNGTHTS